MNSEQSDQAIEENIASDLDTDEEMDKYAYSDDFETDDEDAEDTDDLAGYQPRFVL